MSKKRAFVRYTKSGEIVPGSLIITTNGGYPDKSSLWQEVIADKCCGDGDNGGNCPPITPFCTENWAFENFDGTTFRNGDPIPEVTNNAAWASLTTPAWCYYNNDTAFGRVYGKLYNGYAIMDPRGLAPEGWRIPVLEDWQNLFNCIDCSPNDLLFGPGSKLKTSGFIDNNTGLWTIGSGISSSTNEYGFSILPSGYRSTDGQFLSSTNFTGIVAGGSNYANFWTQEENITNPGWVGCIIFDSQYHRVQYQGNDKLYGQSVRLIKDI